jgi:hypothetical protein
MFAEALRTAAELSADGQNPTAKTHGRIDIARVRRQPGAPEEKMTNDQKMTQNDNRKQS